MTTLQRIREEQEELTHRSEMGDKEWQHMHRKWLKLQRDALAIVRGERCEEHAFEDCNICKPSGPLRPERS